MLERFVKRPARSVAGPSLCAPEEDRVRSTAASCPWELEDALPKQQPLLAQVTPATTAPTGAPGARDERDGCVTVSHRADTRSSRSGASAVNDARTKRQTRKKAPAASAAKPTKEDVYMKCKVDRPTLADAAVSSFKRAFHVRGHDCIDQPNAHDAYESSAIQRNVDAKVMQSLHGASVFKVSKSVR